MTQYILIECLRVLGGTDQYATVEIRFSSAQLKSIHILFIKREIWIWNVSKKGIWKNWVKLVKGTKLPFKLLGDSFFIWIPHCLYGVINITPLEGWLNGGTEADLSMVLHWATANQDCNLGLHALFTPAVNMLSLISLLLEKFQILEFWGPRVY